MRGFLAGLLAALFATAVAAQTVTPPQLPPVGTSGATIPLLNGANTWSGGNTFSGNDIAVHTMTVGLGPGAVTSNVAFGQNALNSNTSGSDNVAIGYDALYTSSTGQYNVAIGYEALLSTTGSYNIGIGYAAGENISAGGTDVAIGYSALNAAAGNNNTAIGDYAVAATTGNDNTGIGYASLNADVGGHDNTAIGYEAGISVTSGSDNTLIGNCAGAAALASTVELCDGAGTLEFKSTSTTLNLPTVPNAAGNEILCFDTTAGPVTYENAVAGCVPSDPRLKDKGAPLDPAVALTKINALTVGTGHFKASANQGSDEHVWLYADQVCAMDKRLCETDKQGVRNYDKTGMLVYAIAAIQAQQQEIDALKREVSALEHH